MRRLLRHMPRPARSGADLAVGVRAVLRALAGAGRIFTQSQPGRPAGRFGDRPTRRPESAALWRGLGRALAAFALLAGTAQAASYGIPINNTGRLTYAVGGTPQPVLASNTVTLMVRSPALIEFLKYAPRPESNGEAVPVAETFFDAGGGNFLPIPQPPPSLNPTVPLLGEPTYYLGETLYLRLTDLDQNLDPGAAETVTITVSCPGTGDEEILRLTETGPNTGIFTAYLPTAASGGTGSDGRLLVAEKCQLTARYVDSNDGTDITADAALVDPYGFVFDSLTGELIDGATVTLIDVATGLPAEVYGDDGVSRYPATVISGGSVTDDGGTFYQFATGGYRFPYVLPGDYRLVVVAPSGYTFPTSVTFDRILSVRPDAVLDPAGSRGEPFPVPIGPAIRIDLPLDPLLNYLWLEKHVSSDQATVGDFLQYRLKLENTSTAVTAPAVTISDHLPPGFRYQTGSTRIAGQRAPNPTISADGRILTFTPGGLPPEGTIEVTYVVEVAAGAKAGQATNRAQAVDGNGARSNVARRTVEVRELFFRDKVFLLGRVLTGSCEQDDMEMAGIPGVRIYLEDGTYVVTDRNGRYHFEGVEPGTHVVQLDLATLPPGFAMLPCEESNQAAGRDFSRFVDLKGGTLWQVNFYAAPQGPLSGDVTLGLRSARDGEVATPRAEVASLVPLRKIAPEPLKPPTLDVLLKSPGTEREIVWPSENFVPEIPNLEVVIRHHPGEQVVLFLNGSEVPLLNFDESKPVPGRDLMLSSWAGVDLGNGRNRLEAVISNAGGDEIVRLQRDLWYVTGLEKVEWLRDESHLLADGIHPPLIALRLTDRGGNPLRPGLQFDYRVSAPYKALRDPATEALASSAGNGRLVTGVGGIAYAQLEPTTQTGQVTLAMALAGGSQEIKIWLTPAAREWILVGFAEGTVGHTTIKENKVSAAEAGVDDHGYTDGRVKFFAKGAIKGEWLLTLAYDSDKPNLDGDSLQQMIDPDTYYPLYGDETRQDYEAASARDVYVKLERDQFYALFGDMQTDLNRTELSVYVRSLNGFKTELRGERFDFTAFVADTRQAFVKDEIRGDGTSGRYPLSRRDLVINSEQVTIEVRDRFHNEVIVKEETLRRHVDYDIDYNDGTLWFKRPIPSKDQEFNPIFIVVRYEVEGTGQANLNYGGRAAVRLFDQRVEIGASHVHEDDGAEEGDLYGVDMTVQLTPQTVVRVEAATTSAEQIDGDNRKGDAWLAEIVHTGEQLTARGYLREQEANFGLGQQNGGTDGLRTYGIDGDYNVSPRWSLSGEAYRQENLETAARRDVGQFQVGYRGEGYGLMTGLREARDRFDDGETRRSLQMIAGGDVTLFNRLTLRAAHEQSLGDSDENADFPTRTLLGADWQLTRNLGVFVEQEFTWGDREDTNATRVGFKSTPWQGGALSSAVTRELRENGERLFVLFGLGQDWQVNDRWSVAFSLDRSYTIKDEAPGERVNPDVPPASGHDLPSRSYRGNDDDFTAVSLGTTYRATTWQWTNRLETRQSDSEEKYGIGTGIVGDIREGLAASARLTAFLTDRDDGGGREEGDITLGLAYRPDRSRWILLERLDVEIDKEDYAGGGDYESWRIVNHLHASYRPNRQWQSSLYYGFKYVCATFDGDRYDGFTDMLALETRRNIGKRWDVGVNGAALHSWNSEQIGYSAGASIGFLAMTNAWVSIGYNLAGFEDDDFSAANYTAQGAYVKFRVKFDQQSAKEAVEWFTK